MGLVDKVRSMVGLREKSLLNPTAQGGIPVDWPSNYFQLGYSPGTTGGGSVVEACVSSYAQTIAQLPGRHYKLDKSGTKEYIPGSRLARVLAKPNGFQTRSDFLLNLVYSLLLDGNAYMVGDGTDMTPTKSIFLLDPRQTSPNRVAGSQDVFYSTGGTFAEAASPDHSVVNIPARFIGHVRLFTPRDPLVGVTPIDAASASVTANNSIVNHQATFFGNMSRPSGVITTEQELTPTQMAQLRAAWNDQAKTLNAGGVPILGSGLNWTPLTMSGRDAELVGAWRMTVEDISRVFRVPPMLINNMENSTFQNAETLMRFWLSSGLGFMINHIELVYAAMFNLPMNEGVEFDTEVLLRSDLQARMEALGTAVTKGIYSPNEARKQEGLAAVEGGDMPRVQQQMVPLDMDLSATINAGPTAPAEPDDEEDEEPDMPAAEAAKALRAAVQQRTAP